jgi:hypothetical protein
MKFYDISKMEMNIILSFYKMNIVGGWVQVNDNIVTMLIKKKNN